ncbi:hypothetical protein MASSI9I_80080 [Massilia sp. 9I]|nr:hypothetical protein MASSI9I_80080 [Massilia sp. 9I]
MDSRLRGNDGLKANSTNIANVISVEN